LSESFGVAVVERATGKVFFCQTACSEIGKVPAAEARALSIHAGASNDFFATNDVTGEVTSCSVDLVNRKVRFVFQSGACQTMRLRH
jgi:tetrahydromethanopterin S-methyltransferase subunit D